MDGRHILVMIFTLLLVVSSAYPAEHQTFVPTSLPTRQTESEALSSWDDKENQPESESQYNSTSSRPSFSLKLQHVNNLYPQDTTPKALFKYLLQRDTHMVNTIFAATQRTKASRHFSSPVTSGYPLGSGEYFTRIRIGTPPKKVYMVLDTGSDIIWLQCSPCLKCYKQTYPIFKPNNSKSFSRVPCKSKLCNLLDYPKCGNRKQCIYVEEYGDGSVSVGEFSTETLTFGKTTKVPKVVFGCGRYNKGLFFAASGLLGLGQGKLSFPGQIRNKFVNKFSYCLGSLSPSSNSSSQLIFGDSPAYGNAVYTPLVKNPKFETYYYVGLEGISVGGSRVHGINASTFDIERKTGNGGVIVDSGTSVTRLRNETYLALRDAFRKGTKHLKRAASKYSIFDTCYDLSRKKEVKVPTVDLHFHGGANMSLPASNYMITVDYNGTVCFAFAGTADSDGGLSIIGNIQQQGSGWCSTWQKNGSGSRRTVALNLNLLLVFPMFFLYLCY